MLQLKLAAVIAAALALGAGAACAQPSTAGETPLGNLVADAVRARAGADAALFPGSALRDVDIKPEQVTSEAVIEAIVDPGQTVLVLQLTGAMLREGLERSVSLLPKHGNVLLQISGISFRYDAGRQPGKRVGEIQMGRKYIEKDTTLTVAMPKSLAQGGLGYFRIWGEVKPSGGARGTVRDAVQALLPEGQDNPGLPATGRMKKI